jgi:chlorobactene glucosyltransferase
MLILFINLLLGYSLFCFIGNSLYLKKSRQQRAHNLNYAKISILIPARNEEHYLSSCLDSLLDQTYPHYEIIVLDDHSTDRSGCILREYAGKYRERVKVCPSLPLPEGWTGKNWACHQLAAKATGDWFAFIDADTLHQPDSLKIAYQEAMHRKSSLLSYLPQLTNLTFTEQLILPIIHFALYCLMPLCLVPKLKYPAVAMAIGTFILIKKETYQAIGGHAAIKSAILEDIQLARQVKAQGKRIDMLDGSGLLSTRFYENSSEIWQGLSRVIFGAFNYQILPFILTCLFSYLIFLHPFLALFAAGWSGSFHTSYPYVLQVSGLFLLRFLVALKTRENPIYTILHPLMITCSLLIGLNSFKIIFYDRTITWKARSYKINLQPPGIDSKRRID